MPDCEITWLANKWPANAVTSSTSRRQFRTHAARDQRKLPLLKNIFIITEGIDLEPILKCHRANLVSTKRCRNHQNQHGIQSQDKYQRILGRQTISPADSRPLIR